MIATRQKIYCTNPDCSQPINSVGDRLCGNCQTPIEYRYLWAVGAVGELNPSETIAQRYEVISGQLWLDTHPQELPQIPPEVPPEIQSYLRLYPQRLHLPQVYGYLDDILLLENIPTDNRGNLYPGLQEMWQTATAIRQVYWLWQIWELWAILHQEGVATSLLIPENIRVQGWCVRLLELHQDTSPPHLSELSESWQVLVDTAKGKIAPDLARILQQIAEGRDSKAITQELNTLLLHTAAELSLNLRIAGATDIGLELAQNEDNCFPTGNDTIDDPLLPQVGIVCDGIGGHEGGEVASRLGVQSTKLQIRALFKEVAEQTEPVSPELLQQQITASLRIVNNLLCSANNEQKRAGTQRMGTTIVMSVQIPQHLEVASGWHAENAHELYIAHVGDSRAYWITQNYCQLLTVDDDVVTREVKQGRSFYRQALQRQDASALTQALGTKDGEFLHPTIQRLILEEDGILLLCSDGLSDRHWVENTWQTYAVPVLNGEMHLEEAVYAWIQLANQKNGHDNTSVVMTQVRINPDSIVPVIPEISSAVHSSSDILIEESELTASSQALLDLELPAAPVMSAPVTPTPPRRNTWILLLGIVALLIGGTSFGLFAWWQTNPQSFIQRCRQLPQKLEQFCPPEK
ncbi:PP2C family protein-serine/threonine phosphatase [Calothrix sp. 336/3]|uniref:PP2C family protein-serine/threonine phosphatase n=1 Tax=Calothrix sp. 336/3 TaxID=1337936 RepID=UPI0004E36333|nr:protein phosphatase 2C domain-containing protein [Calothrix sp. 336/3]AKG23547.1 serine/threonine protein phosphatase [Calothrix sp. 336/3]